MTKYYAPDPENNLKPPKKKHLKKFNYCAMHSDGTWIGFGGKPAYTEGSGGYFWLGKNYIDGTLIRIGSYGRGHFSDETCENTLMKVDHSKKKEKYCPVCSNMGGTLQSCHGCGRPANSPCAQKLDEHQGLSKAPDLLVGDGEGTPEPEVGEPYVIKTTFDPLADFAAWKTPPGTPSFMGSIMERKINENLKVFSEKGFPSIPEFDPSKEELARKEAFLKIGKELNALRNFPERPKLPRQLPPKALGENEKKKSGRLAYHKKFPIVVGNEIITYSQGVWLNNYFNCSESLQSIFSGDLSIGKLTQENIEDLKNLLKKIFEDE